LWNNEEMSQLVKTEDIVLVAVGSPTELRFYKLLNWNHTQKIIKIKFGIFSLLFTSNYHHSNLKFPISDYAALNPVLRICRYILHTDPDPDPALWQYTDPDLALWKYTDPDPGEPIIYLRIHLDPDPQHWLNLLLASNSCNIWFCLGALPYLVGKMGLSCPIYATVPVYKMGQMFLYDTYQVGTW